MTCTHKCPVCREYVSHIVQDCGAPYHVTCPRCRPAVDEAKLLELFKIGAPLSATQYDERNADPLLNPRPDTSLDEWIRVPLDVSPIPCSVFRPFMERLTREQARRSSDATIRTLAESPTSRFQGE